MLPCVQLVHIAHWAPLTPPLVLRDTIALNSLRIKLPVLVVLINPQLKQPLYLPVLPVLQDIIAPKLQLLPLCVQQVDIVGLVYL